MPLADRSVPVSAGGETEVHHPGGRIGGEGVSTKPRVAPATARRAMVATSSKTRRPLG